MRKKNDEAPPDWKDSPTGPTELWKNPCFSNAENLEIADGAIAFRDDTIENLRRRLRAAEADSRYIDFLQTLGRMELRKMPGSMFKTADGDRMMAPFYLAGGGVAFRSYEDLRETLANAMLTSAIQGTLE